MAKTVFSCKYLFIVNQLYGILDCNFFYFSFLEIFVNLKYSSIRSSIALKCIVQVSFFVCSCAHIHVPYPCPASLCCCSCVPTHEPINLLWVLMILPICPFPYTLFSVCFPKYPSACEYSFTRLVFTCQCAFAYLLVICRRLSSIYPCDFLRSVLFVMHLSMCHFKCAFDV